MSARTLRDLEDALSAERESDFTWKSHVFPKYITPVLIEANGKRIIAPMSFGLIPFFEREEKPKKVFHNARVETLHEKVTFKRAFLETRCIIPVDSFFEYVQSRVDSHSDCRSKVGSTTLNCLATGDGPKKVLERFYPEDKGIMLAAGLYGTWKSPSGKSIRSFTMITREPYPFILSHGHDRSPLFLDRTQADKWVESGKKTPEELYKILGDRAKIEFQAETQK